MINFEEESKAISNILSDRYENHHIDVINFINWTKKVIIHQLWLFYLFIVKCPIFPSKYFKCLQIYPRVTQLLCSCIIFFSDSLIAFEDELPFLMRFSSVNWDTVES